ncbi:hypothetical protein Ngar_c12880 [Candidatus Nitrososphaera gargensis Ga9.2]|uniref:Uncharacterized protein n=1 Tax=Nitrososphaera gargensis (strain Ga9.2) TaxID=1237085 RepID=K0IH90_NITGG|nr:hypothetical protein Ngar_c12880 [Candidatus Nitrososphaera gargensis Ga9.2]
MLFKKIRIVQRRLQDVQRPLFDAKLGLRVDYSGFWRIRTTTETKAVEAGPHSVKWRWFYNFLNNEDHMPAKAIRPMTTKNR